LQNSLGLSRARNDPGRTTPFHLKALQGVKIPADRQVEGIRIHTIGQLFWQRPARPRPNP
jgi:hypothetical protein